MCVHGWQTWPSQKSMILMFCNCKSLLPLSLSTPPVLGMWRIWFPQSYETAKCAFISRLAQHLHFR